MRTPSRMEVGLSPPRGLPAVSVSNLSPRSQGALVELNADAVERDVGEWLRVFHKLTKASIE